jgi:hypothetical protein
MLTGTGSPFMAKVIGIHTLSLKLGVNAAEFENFVLKDLFPGLGVVVQVDKTISHGFTLAGWGSATHSLLRNGQNDYLWMIVAEVPGEKVNTEEGRAAVEKEAESKAEEFFDLGTDDESIAAEKLKPFATRTSFSTSLEIGTFKMKGV